MLFLASFGSLLQLAQHAILPRLIRESLWVSWLPVRRVASSHLKALLGSAPDLVLDRVSLHVLWRIEELAKPSVYKKDGKLSK